MDWLHPDHGEKKYGLVASRPSRKEIWTGFIQTIEEIKMDWLHPDHREKKNGKEKMDSSEMELTLFLFPETFQDAAGT